MSLNESELDLKTCNLFLMANNSPWTETFFLFPFCFDIILDVGAYIGQLAILAKALNPKAKVVAIEPCKNSFGQLVKNLDGTDITPHMLGLGSVPHGRMKKEGSSVRNTLKESDVGNVNCMRLSDMASTLCGPLSGKRICLKLNCEGGETSVFDHEPSLDLVEQSDLLLIECHGSEINESYLKLIGSRFGKTHVNVEIARGGSGLVNHRLMSNRLAAFSESSKKAMSIYRQN